MLLDAGFILLLSVAHCLSQQLIHLGITDVCLKSNAHPTCLSSWYCDTWITCCVPFLKWSPCRWLVKPQAAHSVFLDSGGMPYRRLLAVVMFVCFFMRKAWLDALSTWSENRVKLREYMIKESMCHVLLSVKLIVWICSRYFVDFGRARLWSVLVLWHTLRYRPKWHHGTWFWPFGTQDPDRIVMPVARGYDHLLFV